MKRLISIYLLLFINVIFGQATIDIKHKFYQIKFDTILKQPIYTHYTLVDSMLINKYNRTSFKPDKLIKINKQGQAKDYKNQIFDKGHLSPNDDFRFDEVAQIESMYYTNCAPQNKYLNRGVWKSLEQYCRNIAKKHISVEIYTGCIYDGSKQNIGKLKVPTHYWKYIKYGNRIEFYIFPNIKPLSNQIKYYQTNKFDNIIKVIK